MSTNRSGWRQKALWLGVLLVLGGTIILLVNIVLAIWAAPRPGSDLLIALVLFALLAMFAWPAAALIIFYLALGILFVRGLSALRANPKGSDQSIRQMLLILLFGAMFGAVLVFAGLAGPRLGVDPRVALGTIGLSIVLLVFVASLPIRVTAESKLVYPGTPEQLFALGADIELNLHVTGGPRKLIGQTGEPGQPGSSYVTQQGRLILTTSVISSDPPRKLVTSTKGPGLLTWDLERAYTPVLDGTLLMARARQRMTLLNWLLLRRPSVKRLEAAEATRASARIRDYLESLAAETLRSRA